MPRKKSNAMPLLSFRAHNSTGKSKTFRFRKRRQFIQSWKKPTNPDTAKQRAERDKIKTIMPLWAQVSPYLETVNAWKTAAHRRNITSTAINEFLNLGLVQLDQQAQVYLVCRYYQNPRGWPVFLFADVAGQILPAEINIAAEARYLTTGYKFAVALSVRRLSSTQFEGYLDGPGEFSWPASLEFRVFIGYPWTPVAGRLYASGVYENS